MRVLVTAGPTREYIDPARFISNYSTGTFGYEIARSGLRRGWRVTLVSGPTAIKPPAGARFIAVETALEMLRAVREESGKADCVIMAAAVCDWRVRRPSASKIKRAGGKKTLRLVENPDILLEVAKRKAPAALVGFALETENLRENAIKKLRGKGLDMIVANKLTPGSGAFGDKKTDVLIIDRSGRETEAKGRSKRELAEIILDKVFEFTI